MYLGAPAIADSSIKEKSRVRFSAPKMTIKTLIPMPNGVGAYRNAKSTPSSDSSRYDPRREP